MYLIGDVINREVADNPLPILPCDLPVFQGRGCSRVPLRTQEQSRISHSNEPRVGILIGTCDLSSQLHSLVALPSFIPTTHLTCHTR
jgi:hypothetical protein